MITTPNKVCSRCREQKLPDEFHRGKRWVDGRRPECKSCRSVESKECYASWSPERKRQHSLEGKARKAKIQREVLDYLAERPCMDCGERDLRVLEFDHVRGQKEYNVSYLILSQQRAKLWDEIAKCDVVCANCHCRRTSARSGWFKNDY